MDYDAWKLPGAVQKALGNKPPFILRIMERIDSEMVNKLLKSLIGIKPDEPLLIWFNCPGGDVYSGELLVSYIKMLKAPIVSLAAGAVGSMALVVYLSMPKETRFALPGATFLAHFASSRIGSVGQVSIDAKMIAGLKKDAAMRLASFQWDQTIKSDAMLREVVKKSLGKYVILDGVKISIEEFMSYDQNIPAGVAQKIGIVRRVV